MKPRFTCRNCNKTGPAYVSMATPFIHAPWYADYKGLLHGCLYCRSCGAVHDTIGSLFGPIKLLFGRVPSKVVAIYDISAFRKLIRINNPDFISLGRLHDFVIEAMIEDGRLAEDGDLTEEDPTVDFLQECLKDKNYIVRKEATIALRRLGMTPEEADRKIRDDEQAIHKNP